VQRSLATILGRVGEELAPLIIFANYGIEPKDLRHIGSPVDYIAFKGYSSNKRVEEIIFFEIKTGKTAKLSDIEKSVRNVIASGKVRYVVINVKEGLEKLQARLVKPLRRRVGRIQQRRILTNRESGLKTAFCF
jgi:predicted Holliday junction resolvase-like endonuclease